MKLQNRTLKKLSILILLVVGVISSFLYVTSRFDSPNKFNPLVKMQVGYAIVPEKVTYNGGKNMLMMESVKYQMIMRILK